jgi:hypothetical protein
VEQKIYGRSSVMFRFRCDLSKERGLYLQGQAVLNISSHLKGLYCLKMEALTIFETSGNIYSGVWFNILQHAACWLV